MKLAGRKIEGPNCETIVLPRGNAPDIVLKAGAVLDMEEFNRICPEPKPPQIIRRGGVKDFDYKDANYRRMLDERGRLQDAWLVLRSLSVTEALEWETVDLKDPSTWLGYKDELKAAGFSPIEIGRIAQGVFAANCLSEARVEEARQRFFIMEGERRDESTSPKDGRPITPSGEPANASA